MRTCTCGGVTITCRLGCGCVCSSDIDCTRWCEPVEVEPATGRLAATEGGIVRSFKAPDGTERLLVGMMALQPDDHVPRYQPGTRLHGCMHGATLQSLALVLGTLHGLSVTAPADRAKQSLDEEISGTLEEIAARFGLVVAL